MSMVNFLSSYRVKATVFQFLLEMFIIIDPDSCEKELLNSTFPFG